jgi:hypothetical protein
VLRVLATGVDRLELSVRGFARARVVVAAVSGALGAIFGYRAVVAGRESVAEGRRAVAEGRTARQEERLYQELARLERVIDLLKRMWAILNRAATWRVPPASPATAAARQEAEHEMDALLYQLRAALAVFDRDELPRCRHFEESNDGPAALGHAPQIQEAESEVMTALRRCREALRALGQPPVE